MFLTFFRQLYLLPFDLERTLSCGYTRVKLQVVARRFIEQHNISVPFQQKWHATWMLLAVCFILTLCSYVWSGHRTKLCIPKPNVEGCRWILVDIDGPMSFPSLHPSLMSMCLLSIKTVKLSSSAMFVIVRQGSSSVWATLTANSQY